MSGDVVRLDCASVESTERSLSAMFHVEPAVLHQRCRDFDFPRHYDHTDNSRGLTSLILQRDIPDDGYIACFFHGTRSVDPIAQFADGLRPLGEIVDRVWSDLEQIASRYCDERAWERFRRSVEQDHPAHNACLYRMKVNDRLHWGPMGFLIREVALKPKATGCRDYTNRPAEIVEDICICFKESHGIDLEYEYSQATRPCLIKFQGRADSHYVDVAVEYLCLSIHRRGFSAESPICYNAGDVAVPAEDIVLIEIDPSP